MLTCIKDDFGNIICACEWRKVNAEGKFDKEGKYIWVHEVEISKPYRNKGILYKLIKEIIKEMPDFEYAYFWRDKYKLRVRRYAKERWLRLIKEREYAMA